MLPIINTVLPVFLLIGIGAGLQRGGFFSSDFARGLTRLVYWVALPCLLFDKIAAATFSWTPIVKILCAFHSAIVLSLVIGFMMARWRKLSRLSTGAFVQACYRGNLGYVGLPLVMYAGSSLYPQHSATLNALAILTLAPTALVYNSIAVLLMVGSKEKLRWDTRHYLTKSIVTNPIVLSALVGILFASMQWQLPQFLSRTIHSLGNTTIALALVSMGAIFTQVPFRGVLKDSMLAASVKVILAPALGFLMVWLLALKPMEACIVLLFLAAPTAVSSFVFVEQFKGDEQLAVNAVVVSTLMSIVSLPVVLWLLQQFS